MANQYLVTQRILSTGAHLCHHPAAAEHFKAFLSGTRNGMRVLDTDHSAVCLRSAVTFLSSLIARGGRVFFPRTRNDLKDEVLQRMAARLSCAADTQMGIQGFSTNTPGLRANPSRRLRIALGGGPRRKPDCFVLLGSFDRKFAVIQEAHCSQIPTVCLVDPSMPFQCFRKVTYPVPAVDTPSFVYLFCNLLTKSVLRDRQKPVLSALPV